MSVLVSSCVATKKKGDISKAKQFWHNTTALYNGYFNAREILQLTELAMAEESQDNYTALLPLYDYQITPDAAPYHEDLDKAIEKVARVSALHGPSYWIDDCYVLMGQAQYMKRDYESAEETLEFFKEEFTADNPYSTFYKKQQGTKKTSAQRKREREIEQRQREEERQIKDKAREDEKKERDKLKKDEKKARDKAKKEEQKARDKERKARAKAKKKGQRYVPPVKAQETIDKERAEAQKKALKDTKEQIEEEAEEEDEEEEGDDEKKEDKDQKDKAFNHEPAYYDGLLWLAKTYIERERFSAAEATLRRVANVESVQKSTRNSMSLIYADLYIKKGDYTEAISNLDNAIEGEKKKKRRARYSYIKGQLYERMGMNSEALASYEQCKSFNPDFVMEFNADLNRIRLDQSSGLASSDKSVDKLLKMLKEEKYDFYHSDIYFAIAEIKRNEGNLEEAKYAYQNSVRNNLDNLPLKIESYYRLANMFFDAEEYATAKYYYDSTTMVMPKTDIRYADADNLAKNLSQIAKNIEIINAEEEGLRLASLSDKELRKVAIDRIKEQNIPISRGDNNSGAVSIPKSNYRLNVSSFFAYNPVSIQKGIDDFNRIWGDVELKDNWRTSSGGSFEITEEEDAFDEDDISDEMIAEVLKDIPSSKVQKDLSKKKIQDAKFELGRLYREKLENLEKGVEEHEDLYSNYNNFYKEEELLFYLYLSNKDLGRMRKAKQYKKDLSEKYPDSEYLKILDDPGYAERLLSNEGSIESFYDKVYSQFNNDNHEKVLKMIGTVEEKYPEETSYKSKFALLEAMSIGSTRGKDEYMIALDDMVKKYPSADETIRAKEILRFLKGDDAAFDPVLFTEGAQSFEKEEDKLHYGMVVVYKLDDFKTNEVKEDINKYIKKHHNLDRLSLSNIGLNRDLDSQIILIRKFENEESAMDFYDGVLAKDAEFIQEDINYDFLMVTQNNYREIIKKRSIKEYLQFFEQNY